MNTSFLKNILALILGFFTLQTVSAQQPNKEAIGGLSREEKNTMTNCPLHQKRMGLSDNYRANASDFRQSEDYPFAYQLNYRRFCGNCTKALEKEEKAFKKEEASGGNKATMERCAIHSEFMKTNPEFSSVNSVKDKDREKDILHAKQYKGRLYCKTCSKVYSIRNKAKEEAKKEEGEK